MKNDENSKKDVVTWKLLQEAKHYRIGDMNTRLIDPDAPEPEYGRSALETLILRVSATEVLGKIIGEITGPMWMAEMTSTDPKAEARKRSREDVERKRRELRRKR